MSHPVVTFCTTEKVCNIVHVLRTEKHDGFPVVERDEENVRITILHFVTLTGFLFPFSVFIFGIIFQSFSWLGTIYEKCTIENYCNDTFGNIMTLYRADDFNVM